jgi:hypothetical protein
VPDDRIQVVEPDPATDDADVGMKWKNKVPSEIPPGDAHVADDADQPSTRNQYAVHVPPHLLQLEKESLVVLNVPELVGVLIVALEIPVRR